MSQRTPFYLIRKEIQKSLDLGKELYAQRLAAEVLELYNSSKGTSTQTKTTLFFHALDFVWKAHHFHDQKIIHPWHKKDAFYQAVIFWCQQQQPPGELPSADVVSNTSREKYVQTVLEEVEHIFFIRKDSDGPRRAFIFATQSTWHREHTNYLCEITWESCKVFKSFLKKYFLETKSLGIL